MKRTSLLAYATLVFVCVPMASAAPNSTNFTVQERTFQARVDAAIASGQLRPKEAQDYKRALLEVHQYRNSHNGAGAQGRLLQLSQKLTGVLHERTMQVVSPGIGSSYGHALGGTREQLTLIERYRGLLGQTIMAEVTAGRLSRQQASQLQAELSDVYTQEMSIESAGMEDRHGISQLLGSLNRIVFRLNAQIGGGLAIQPLHLM